MKLDSWMFTKESAHRDGVELIFRRAASRSSKGALTIICTRAEVKEIVSDLRPGAFVEISISPGTAPPVSAPTSDSS